MGMIRDGLAKHGDAWFARDQYEGKGQQGKIWKARPGANLILSIVIVPPAAFIKYPPLFNMFLVNKVADFIQKKIDEKIFIKWPNDLYWSDRKAGGILIENRYYGKNWKWSVIGIGINVNQNEFADSIPNPISLCQITGKKLDPIGLGRNLHAQLIEDLEKKFSIDSILKNYNSRLYKKDDVVKLKKGNMIFSTTIDGVDRFGRLLTHDVISRVIEHGSVVWQITPPGKIK